jgi:hypothetical protein
LIRKVRNLKTAEFGGGTRHIGAMAAVEVGLEAEEARSRTSSDLRNFFQHYILTFEVGQKTARVGRPIAVAPIAIADWFGASHGRSMVVIDPDIMQSRGEGAFRETRFPRKGICADIDDRLDTHKFESRNERLQGQTLVSECEDLIRHGWPVIVARRVCLATGKKALTLPVARRDRFGQRQKAIGAFALGHCATVFLNTSNRV